MANGFHSNDLERINPSQIIKGLVAFGVRTEIASVILNSGLM